MEILRYLTIIFTQRTAVSKKFNGRPYARIFVRPYYLLREGNCFPFCAEEQIISKGKHLRPFSRQMKASGLAGHIQLRDAFRKIACKRKYLVDY